MSQKSLINVKSIRAISRFHKNVFQQDCCCPNIQTIYYPWNCSIGNSSPIESNRILHRPIMKHQKEFDTPWACWKTSPPGTLSSLHYTLRTGIQTAQYHLTPQNVKLFLSLSECYVCFISVILSFMFAQRMWIVPRVVQIFPRLWMNREGIQKLKITERRGGSEVQGDTRTIM